MSTALQFAARYDVTAKFQINGALNRTRRSLVETVASGSGTSGNDTSRAASIGARYLPNRNWLLECNVARESRSSETTLSYAYRANVARCSAQFLVY